jgi:UDP-MurNAc hydroxylase
VRVTCTGHAGLFIETAHGSILCDPWRSPAYFASWFVFPDNAAVAFEELAPDYLYLSHLHRDHYDPELLHQLIPKTTTVSVSPRSCPRRTASPSSSTACGS